MSKTKEYKKVLYKYLAQLTFTKTINENDSKIIDELLSDDTIILSKKTLKKYIKVKELSDETLPPHLVRFGEIKEWKENHEPTLLTDIKIAKDRYVEVFEKKREIYLDFKIQQPYVYCEGDEKYVEEWKQLEPLADDYFLNALENIPD